MRAMKILTSCSNHVIVIVLCLMVEFHHILAQKLELTGRFFPFRYIYEYLTSKKNLMGSDLKQQGESFHILMHCYFTEIKRLKRRK